MISIRPAILDDLRYLAAIEQAAAILYPKERVPQPKETLPENMLIDALKEQLLFCGEFNNALAGFACCHLYRNFLHLDEISVHPDFGKQGLGTALVKYILEECKKRKLKACTLTTFADLNWNAPFYKKLGFNEMEKQEIPRHVAAILREERSTGLKQRTAMIFEFAKY